MKTSIEFVNHASIIVSYDGVSVLSDPWYFGDAFNKGWKLLHETETKEVENILNRITHIWISHEHPDHFSIPFFRKFHAQINNRSIMLLFQSTKDKRVVKFLKSLNLNVIELPFNKAFQLSESYTVTCIKDGFYDSGLLIDSGGEKILNLNDCEVTTPKRLKEVYSITGVVDVLLTQFSYAAWKGGKSNDKWRNEAASEKIKTVQAQVDTFVPKYTIPFASYMYFCNESNLYLNDAVNNPRNLLTNLDNLIVMAPGDVLGGNCESINVEKALKFWDKKYEQVYSITPVVYQEIDFEQIKLTFSKYCSRIREKNNLWLMWFIRFISPISIFEPVIIRLTDTSKTIKFDYINQYIELTNDKPLLSMESASLDFLFKNSFGFDTLTVNGCFEEEQKNGFVTATKTLAIENLNNLGLKIELKTFINIPIIALFLNRLSRIARKLE